jgi:soluble lytic murein transglycosylase-like protein
MLHCSKRSAFMSLSRLRLLLCAAFASAAAMAESPVIEVAPHVEVQAAAQPQSQPQPQDAPAAVPTDAEMRRYAAIIRGACRANGVEGELVHAMIWAESSFNPNAVSPAGAGGLMQLMPETARSYGVRDVFDPEQNIRAGVKIMGQLLAQFDGDVELALAAYNAGPNAVIRAGNRIPAHPETEAYVPKVMDYYRRLQARKA